jgi:hypothetical protein
MSAYWFHDPESLIIVLSFLELLIKDDVFAGELEGGREEVVLVGLLLVVLLVEVPLELLEVLVEHILAAELIPSSEMIDPHVGQDTMPLKYPVHLFLLAPNYIPVIIPSLLPLSIYESIVNAIFESSFEFYARPESPISYGCVG